MPGMTFALRMAAHAPPTMEAFPGKGQSREGQLSYTWVHGFKDNASRLKLGG